eukprot:7079980-Prymnesium_polylepis.1
MQKSVVAVPRHPERFGLPFAWPKPAVERAIEPPAGVSHKTCARVALAGELVPQRRVLLPSPERSGEVGLRDQMLQLAVQGLLHRADGSRRRHQREKA